MRPEEIHKLAQHFNYAAQVRFKESEFYQLLCDEISRDLELLSLASFARTGQLPSYLLLGAVHDIILAGVSHPLVSIYRKISTGLKLEDNPFPVFRNFCLKHKAALCTILSTRRVQTNEVGRSAFIRLGLEQVQKWAEGKPISLVEVGASAGLNLAFDRYALQFIYQSQSHSGRSGILTVGDMVSPVRLCCEIRGNRTPVIGMDDDLHIVERLGIDLSPPDLHSPEDIRWLLALVWPNQPERAERLRLALDLAREWNWPVIRADATFALADVCEALRMDSLLCVFHSHFLLQLSEASRGHFESQMSQIAANRDLAQLAIERFSDDISLTFTKWSSGKTVEEQVLAVCDAYGNWIEWKAD